MDPHSQKEHTEIHKIPKIPKFNNNDNHWNF